MIHLVGLGPGGSDSLSPRAVALLTGALPVFVRTLRHPVFDRPPLQALRPKLVGLDDEYETNASFEQTYAAIVARLLRAQAAHGAIVYAVPGHPLVGERTVALLLSETRAKGIPTAVVPAPSFVDACLEALGEAVVGDLHVVDALSLDPADPAPPAALRGEGPILLYQVHSREAASQAKLALMRAGFPDEQEVKIVRGAGIPERQRVETLPLFELDRRPCDHLTTVWVPALPARARRPDFDALRRVMARLRAPEGGCPWDLEQTHASLRRYVLEEAYEVAEAIDQDEPDHLCEELGDLLLQVVFHAQIAAEEGLFDADDVCAVLVEKLIRRHPHVFAEVDAPDAQTVLANWEAIKAQEKGHGERRSVLDGISASLPALTQALLVSQRVVRVGFEWPALGQVLDKVDEELAELRVEIASGDTARVAAELGDLLFTLVNVARRSGIDPEDALRRQLTRFTRRWRHIEEAAAVSGRDVSALSLAEMETLWREAKRAEV